MSKNSQVNLVMESDNESIDSMSSFDDLFDRILTGILREYLPEWNPLTRIEDYDMESGRPWNIIQEEECEKIASLSTEELFSYINYAVSTEYGAIMVHHASVYECDFIFGITGPDAANEYEKTLIAIVMKLKNRLEEEKQISDDIQNVRKVMTGNISISDHTALSCVYKRMRNTASASKIRRYMEKMTDLIKNVEAIFQLHHLHLQKEENERLKNGEDEKGALQSA